MSRKNGAIVPNAIIQPASSHTGRWCACRCPPSGVLSVRSRTGNDHHGTSTAQKSDANRNPQASNDTGSRPSTTCSASRTYNAYANAPPSANIMPAVGSDVPPPKMFTIKPRPISASVSATQIRRPTCWR